MTALNILQVPSKVVEGAVVLRVVLDCLSEVVLRLLQFQQGTQVVMGDGVVRGEAAQRNGIQWIKIY